MLEHPIKDRENKQSMLNNLPFEYLKDFTKKELKDFCTRN